MSIFGIVGIGLLITFVLLLVSFLVQYINDEDWGKKGDFIRLIVGTCFCVLFILGGIGINTENERIFVKKYLAQKETIEVSLEVEELSSLERLELVKQATELNGEVAERKALFELWHFVVYDNTIYDNVELINLNKK